MLRVPEGGKNLDVIASPPGSGYTVSYLRAVVHHAKVYIRPMQKDLSLEPLKEPVSNCYLSYDLRSVLMSILIQSFLNPPKEQCLTCGQMVSVTSLREHIVTCKQE